MTYKCNTISLHLDIVKLPRSNYAIVKSIYANDKSKTCLEIPHIIRTNLESRAIAKDVCNQVAMDYMG